MSKKTHRTSIDKMDAKINEILKKRLSTQTNKLKKAMTRGTLVVRDTVILGLQRSAKSGRIYEKYNPRRTHQASAGGQYPATDTGFLVSQISTNVKVSGSTIMGQIISSAPYSKALEFGHTNRDGSFTEERPFMQPSLTENENNIKKIFAQEGVLKS